MVTKFAKWNAKEGKFLWYDKERKEEVELIIDEFPVVRVGFNYSGRSDSNGGMWSNEVVNFVDEDFVVCNKDGCIGRGKYDELFIDGCELNVVVYGKVNDDEFAIMCKGTGYHSLVKALANVNIDKNMLKYAGVFNAEKDGNQFLVPLFGKGSDKIVDVSDLTEELKLHYEEQWKKYDAMKIKPDIKDVILDDIDSDLEF